MEFDIVPMKEEDIDEVLEIEGRSFPTPWSKKTFLSGLKNPQTYIFLAKKEMDGKETLLGYVCFWIVVDEAHILNLAVHPDFRRKGIGKRLLAFALDFSKERGAVFFALEVRSRNRVAIDIYRSFGFKEVGVRKGYYQDTGEDAVLMELELKGQTNVSS